MTAVTLITGGAAGINQQKYTDHNENSGQNDFGPLFSIPICAVKVANPGQVIHAEHALYDEICSNDKPACGAIATSVGKHQPKLRFMLCRWVP
jgi:hypothetical protein